MASVWVGADCLGHGVELRRRQPAFAVGQGTYNNKVGVGVYGKTRMLVKSFRIRRLSSEQGTGKI